MKTINVLFLLLTVLLVACNENQIKYPNENLINIDESINTTIDNLRNQNSILELVASKIGDETIVRMIIAETEMANKLVENLKGNIISMAMYGNDTTKLGAFKLVNTVKKTTLFVRIENMPYNYIKNLNDTTIALKYLFEKINNSNKSRVELLKENLMSIENKVITLVSDTNGSEIDFLSLGKKYDSIQSKVLQWEELRFKNSNLIFTLIELNDLILRIETLKNYLLVKYIEQNSLQNNSGSANSPSL